MLHQGACVWVSWDFRNEWREAVGTREPGWCMQHCRTCGIWVRWDMSTGRSQKLQCLKQEWALLISVRLPWCSAPVQGRVAEPWSLTWHGKENGGPFSTGAQGNESGFWAGKWAWPVFLIYLNCSFPCLWCLLTREGSDRCEIQALLWPASDLSGCHFCSSPRNYSGSMSMPDL